MKKLLLLSFAIFLAILVRSQNADDAIGLWVNPSGSAKIKIFRTGEYFYGTLAWLDKPLTNEGKPRLDDKNPDQDKRSRKLQGLLIMTGFTFDPKSKHWHEGEIYDAKSGTTYSCKMTMKSKDELDIRGYVGISLIGRSEIWKRVE